MTDTTQQTPQAPVKSGLGALAIIGITLGIILLIAGSIIGILVSAHNKGNKYENDIIGTYNNNQNILSNYSNKVIEAAKVPAQYKKDLIELTQAEMQGRYGDPKASKNVLANWIQERQLTFDSSLYTRLQAIIEEGRNKFENNQTRLIDQKAQYNTALGNWPGGIFMTLVGYPKIKLDDYKVVINGDVINTFDTGVDKPVDMFNK